MSKISMWKGKKIEDCSREELLEALEYACQFVERHYEPATVKARIDARFENFVSGAR